MRITVGTKKSSGGFIIASGPRTFMKWIFFSWAGIFEVFSDEVKGPRSKGIV